MSCGSKGVIRHPRSVIPILVASATCIPVRKNRVDCVNSLLADTRILEEGIVGSAAVRTKLKIVKENKVGKN
jgi:hypothetical protein